MSVAVLIYIESKTCVRRLLSDSFNPPTRQNWKIKIHLHFNASTHSLSGEIALSEFEHLQSTIAGS